ncbi:MAG TPA: CvpA family protein [Candidatus Saccharimonadales bacterium]|nr:CvpA family protein [Candidatus Saccharimonadales bacterium]
MLQNILNTVSQQTGLNWIDLLCIGVMIYYITEGIIAGFISAVFDFIKFITSFIVGLKFYILAGNVLLHFFTISQGFAYAIGFFLTSFIVELVLHFLLRRVFIYIAEKLLYQKPLYQQINRILGTLPGIFSALVLLTFLLTVIVTLPVSPFLKKSVSQSKIGNSLIAQSQVFEKDIGGVFGGAAKDTLNFLTVEPKSNESVSLNFRTNNYSIDISAENQMLQLMNKEREKAGRKPLVMNTLLQKVARAHAGDMLERGYFSHYTPEGLSPFDRMNQAGVVYTYGGENLAFSPNVQLAMQGLMNSPGHRENILSPNYHKVGVGVLDAKIYGEMFVQEFSD